MHPWGAVGAPGSLMDLADQPSQLRVADRPGARRAALPGVEPRAGHLEGRQSRLTPKAWRCSETNRKRLTGSSPWRNRLPCGGFRVPSAAPHAILCRLTAAGAALHVGSCRERMAPARGTHTGCDVRRAAGGRSDQGFLSWARWGSNPRPSDYESPALTTELQALMESSGGGTRTHNLPVNSRMLCRLSYPRRAWRD